MTRCPHCNIPLTSDEARGGNCPSCGGALSTSVTTAPWERESPPHRFTMEEDSYRETAPASRSVLGWASVRTSFTLFVTGWILLQGSMLLLLLITETLRNARGGMPGGILVLATLVNLAIVAGAVHFLTGMCMALAVPGESSVKGWGVGIVFSLALSLAALLILTGSVGGFGGDPGLAKVLSYLFLGGLFLAKVLYTGFVQGLARHFRYRGLALAALMYLVLELGLFIWVFVRSARNEPFRRHNGPLDEIFGGAGSQEEHMLMIIVSTVMCAWFVSMVLVVRSAITRTIMNRSS
jgi:hypothetical protein